MDSIRFNNNTVISFRMSDILSLKYLSCVLYDIFLRLGYIVYRLSVTYTRSPHN